MESIDIRLRMIVITPMMTSLCLLPRSHGATEPRSHGAGYSSAARRGWLLLSSTYTYALIFFLIVCPCNCGTGTLSTLSTLCHRTAKGKYSSYCTRIDIDINTSIIVELGCLHRIQGVLPRVITGNKLYTSKYMEILLLEFRRGLGR